MLARDEVFGLFCHRCVSACLSLLCKDELQKGSSPEQLSVKSATDVSCMLTNVEYFLNTFFFYPICIHFNVISAIFKKQITGTCLDISTQVENANWKLQDRTNINHA